MINGYSENQKRLQNVNKVLEITSRSADSNISGLSNVLISYADGLDLLDDYDHQSLKIPKGTREIASIDYDNAVNFINEMKFSESSNLFGKERDSSFKSSLNQIYQTYNGIELYPSIQEKASNLLYLIVKNHSFVDGNKRIAAGIFLKYLNDNKILSEKSISNNTLTALTLMTALSKPEEKDIITKMIMNFITSK
jgi:prophage maintenance system killer protein